MSEPVQIAIERREPDGSWVQVFVVNDHEVAGGGAPVYRAGPVGGVRPGALRPSPEWLNVGCGTHNAPAPWWNVDVMANEVTHPDDVVPRGPLPYDDDTIGRVYLGHLVEHVPWGTPLLEVLVDVRRVMKPGAELLVVSPDVDRTLERWKADLEPWHMVESNMEHARGRADIDGEWPEARHWWNCTEARVVMILQAAGFLDVRAVAVPGPELDGWPVVGPALWQCAALAVA